MYRYPLSKHNVSVCCFTHSIDRISWNKEDLARLSSRQHPFRSVPMGHPTGCSPSHSYPAEAFPPQPGRIKTLSLKVPVLLKHFCSKDFEVPLYFESDWIILMMHDDNDNDRPKQFQIWVHVGRCPLFMTWRYGGVLSWQLQSST